MRMPEGRGGAEGERGGLRCQAGAGSAFPTPVCCQAEPARPPLPRQDIWIIMEWIGAGCRDRGRRERGGVVSCVRLHRGIGLSRARGSLGSTRTRTGAPPGPGAARAPPSRLAVPGGGSAPCPEASAPARRRPGRRQTASAPGGPPIAAREAPRLAVPRGTAGGPAVCWRFLSGACPPRAPLAELSVRNLSRTVAVYRGLGSIA